MENKTFKVVHETGRLFEVCAYKYVLTKEGIATFFDATGKCTATFRMIGCVFVEDIGVKTKKGSTK